MCQFQSLAIATIALIHLAHDHILFDPVYVGDDLLQHETNLTDIQFLYIDLFLSQILKNK